MEYFIYNGIDSRDFKLYLVNDGRLKSNVSPAKQSYTINVPSLNGKILTSQKYKERTVELKCFLTDTTASNINMIMSWLGQKGEEELILSYENYKVYKATFENQLNMDNYMNGGVFVLEFKMYNPISKSRIKTISNPAIEYNQQNYYNTGLIYGLTAEDYSFENIIVTTDIEIYHGGSVNGALPVININGSADDIVITQYTDSTRTVVYKQLSYGSFSGNLVFDCEVRNTFLDGNLNNTSFDGKYLELFGKTNWEFLSKGYVQEVYDVSSEVVLGINESDTDDIYNGYVVIFRSGDGFNYFNIDDYDGTTKTITVSGNTGLSDITEEWSYAIYDPADGLNYITIDGTNLNLTDISFDFNFIYL